MLLIPLLVSRIRLVKVCCFSYTNYGTGSVKQCLRWLTSIETGRGLVRTASTADRSRLSPVRPFRSKLYTYIYV